MRSKARFKIVRAGRRFGKSYFASIVLLQEAVKLKGDYWFISPTYKQSKEIIWRMLINLIPLSWVAGKNETELSFYLTNGSTIKLKGADNEDSLRGVGLAGCVMDEYAFMKPFVWEEIVRPMLFDSGGWAMFISTPKGYNHFYQLWESTQDKKDWDRFHFTTYDNPYIKPEEIEEAKTTMSPERFEQEIMAEFTKKSGAVWPMFKRDLHCKERRNPASDATTYGAIDFGFAVGHPTSVAWFECKGEEIFIFDGFLEEGLTIDKVSEKMRQQTQGLTIRGIVPDPARPDLIESLKRLGWQVIETDKDIELGVAKVAEYWQINPLTNKPRMTISEHLSEGIRQIEEYEWQEVRGEDGQFKQVPKKENDDFCDAVRYYVMSNQKEDKPLRIIGHREGFGGAEIPIYG